MSHKNISITKSLIIVRNPESIYQIGGAMHLYISSDGDTELLLVDVSL